jgi:hypothetical protein
MWEVEGRARCVRRAPADPVDGSTFVISDSLGYLMNRAARLMARMLGDKLRPAGVGIGQWAVHLVLWVRDGARQAELARMVAIS